MKIFLLFFVFGLAAAADFLRYAAPQVDEAVESFLESFGKTGTLRNVLGLPDAVELDEAEEDGKKEVGDILREHLENLLNKINDHIEKGVKVKEELIKRVKEIKEKLKDFKEDLKDKAKELLEKLKNKAKDKLKEILEKYGLAKRSLEHSSKLIERSDFHEVIEKVKNKILENETIRKIRDYIRNFVTTNPEVQKIKEFLLRLREVDFREFLRTIFERHGQRNSRGVKEGWEKVKGWFEGLKEKVRDHTKTMQEFLKEKWSIGLEKLKGHVDIVRAIAKELFEHIKDIHGELAREAIEFLLPYKEDLGALGKELFKMLKDHLTKE